MSKFSAHNPKGSQTIDANVMFLWSANNFYRTSNNDMTRKVNT